MSTFSHHICVYNGCFNENRTTKNVSFFKFPVRNPKLTEKWKKNCGNIHIIEMDNSELKNRLVCQNHFSPAHVYGTDRRKNLRRNAAPVKFCEQEQFNDETKAKNIPGEDEYGIKQEKLDAASLLHGTFESLENEWQNEAQYEGGDSAYKCELCGKTFATNRYLALHMKIHSEQPDESFEESHDELIKDSNASEAIEIKSEFSEEDSVINFGNTYNGISDEKSKIIDYDLIQVKKEQCDDEIKNENKSNNDQDSVEEELQVTKTEFVNCEKLAELEDTVEVANCTEFVNCEKPSSSKRAQTKGAHKCEICNKSFTTNKYLVYHTNLHTAELVKCDICNRNIKSIALRQHIKAHALVSRQQGSSHKCETCNKSFARRQYLVSHMKIHTGLKKLKCNICGKHYQASYMERHIRKHTGVKPFICEVCGKAYKNNDNLKMHFNSHLGGEKIHKCNFCEKAFLRKDTLKDHITISHSKSNSPQKCEICNKEFPTKKYLLRHKNSHKEVLFKCNSCNKQFTIKNLLRHVGTHKNCKVQLESILSYKCATCNKCFAKKKYLASHVKIHTGNKMYKCNICDMEYRGSYLKRHMSLHRRKHQFECDVCGKKFVTKQSLVSHTNGHLEEKNAKV